MMQKFRIKTYAGSFRKSRHNKVNVKKSLYKEHQKTVPGSTGVNRDNIQRTESQVFE